MYVKNEYYSSESMPDLSADIQIVIKLKQSGLCFHSEKYEHSYPHCWRTDKPILYYPMDSWFVKTTEYKEKMIALNNTINWKPKSTGEGRFGNWLENLVDWNLLVQDSGVYLFQSGEPLMATMKFVSVQWKN